MVSGEQEMLILSNVPVGERNGVEKAYILLRDLEKLSFDEREVVHKYYEHAVEEKKKWVKCLFRLIMNLEACH